MLCSTIRDILVRTERKYGREDAVRYKVKKDTIESKTYTCLKNDSESFPGCWMIWGKEASMWL